MSLVATQVLFLFLFLVWISVMCIRHNLLSRTFLILRNFFITQQHYYYYNYSSTSSSTSCHPASGEEIGIKCCRYERKQGSEDCGGGAECAVCLCKIKQGDEVKELRCNHFFHGVCLDKWFGYKHSTCPLCRCSVAAPPPPPPLPTPSRNSDEFGVHLLCFNFSSIRSSERTSWGLR